MPSKSAVTWMNLVDITIVSYNKLCHNLLLTLQACSVGTTTTSIAATSFADCDIAMRGHRPIHDTEGHVVGAEPCPIGTYSSKGTSCDACPDGLTTQAPQQASVAACLAPPGYGYYPNNMATFNATQPGASNVTAGTPAVSPCPSGTYKTGWNLERCRSCGVGFLTEPTPAISPDHCYLPPGHGSKISSDIDIATDSQLVAVKCMKGTYGSDSKQYGLWPMPCQVSLKPPHHN